MEITLNRYLKERLSGFVFKESRPFTSRREVNWGGIKKLGVFVVVVTVLGLLLMPNPTPEQATFHEKADPGTAAATTQSAESEPTKDTLAQFQSSRANGAGVPSSLDYLYRTSGEGASEGARGSAQDENAAMVVVRVGQDSKQQLPPGSGISVRLIEQITVSGQGRPVLAVVAKEVTHEDSLAIPQGAKVLGEVSFDESSDRAQLSWHSIIFPDGRERPFSAVGVSSDGQVGVEGKVHSEAIKNTIGQALTRFIGAYAEGSITRGQLGAAEGGHQNGLKNAFAETAKDRARAWADDMRKERKWIELNRGAESLAVLNQPFVFRDPGVTYGR